MSHQIKYKIYKAYVLLTSCWNASDVDWRTFIVRSQYIMRYMNSFLIQYQHVLRWNCNDTMNMLSFPFLSFSFYILFNFTFIQLIKIFIKANFLIFSLLHRQFSIEQICYKNNYFYTHTHTQIYSQIQWTNFADKIVTNVKIASKVSLPNVIPFTKNIIIIKKRKEFSILKHIFFSIAE